MTKKGFLHLTSLTTLLLSACSQDMKVEQNAPVSTKEQRQLGFGSLLGEEGLSFGKASKKEEFVAGGVAANVNPYLWRATLDTFDFAPITVSDPVGGLISTDWYAADDKANERVKVNIKITSKTLRADGLKVTVFKQIRKGNDWMSLQADDKIGYDLETIILNRARQLKIKSTE